MKPHNEIISRNVPAGMNSWSSMAALRSATVALASSSTAKVDDTPFTNTCISSSPLLFLTTWGVDSGCDTNFRAAPGRSWERTRRSKLSRQQRSGDRNPMNYKVSQSSHRQHTQHTHTHTTHTHSHTHTHTLAHAQPTPQPHKTKGRATRKF
jgi:ABC-type nickel/cobalt efflux system permease component RcnA